MSCCRRSWRRLRPVRRPSAPPLGSADGPPERQQLRKRRRPRDGTGAAQPAQAPPPTLESVVLRLQSELGNAAAARLLARQPVKAEPAEPPITRMGVTGAQDWFDRAHAHYQAGRYEKAMHAYREAYRLYPVNSFLYNVGACLEQLGRKGEAADMYERYLNEMPKGQSDPKEPKIREHIKTLRGRLLRRRRRSSNRQRRPLRASSRSPRPGSREPRSGSTGPTRTSRPSSTSRPSTGSSRPTGSTP